MEYIFIACLVLDIFGAILLSKAVFVSSTDTLKRANSYWGFNPDLITYISKDKADAFFGILALICGFLVQLLGYVFQVLDKDLSFMKASLAEVEILIALIPLVFFILAWSILRKRVTKSNVLRVTKYMKQGNDRETVLIRCAVLIGYQPEDLRGDKKLCCVDFVVHDSRSDQL